MGQVSWVCPLMIFLSVPQWNMSPKGHCRYIPFSLSLSHLSDSLFSFLHDALGASLTCKHTYAVSISVERSCVWQDMFGENVAQWKPPAEEAASLSLSVSLSLIPLPGMWASACIITCSKPNHLTSLTRAACQNHPNLYF